MSSPKRTLYEIVGVAPDASAEDIELACNERRAQLSAEASPDMSTLALVRHAREVLTNPERRAAYDARIAAAAAAEIPVLHEGDKPQPVPVLESAGAQPARRIPWGLVAVFGAAALIAILFVARMMTNRVPPAPVAEAPKPPPPPPAPVALTPSQIISAASPSIARLQSIDLSGNVQALGLAVAVEPGIVVSTCHAIPANAAITATLGADKGAATLVITDEVLDLCKLSVAGVEPRAIGIAAAAARPGDAVFVVSPDAPGSYALAEATVKQVVRTPGGDLIQLSTSAANGAPILDATGKLVGIATNGSQAVPASAIAQAKSRARAS